MSRRLRIGALVVAVVLASWTTVSVRGQAGAPKGEWPTYGGDLGHTRYAPLDQISAANFSKLEVAWRFKTDNLGPRLEFNLESTPLMVGGRSVLDRRHPPGGRRARRGHRRVASGCTARTKALAAPRRRDSCRAAGSPTGPTAKRNAFST